MKKLIALLIVITVISCKKETTIDYVLFSGTVSNSDAENILVYGNGFQKEIEIKEGTFSDTLKIEDAGYYSFRVDRESSALHLDKGDNINLTINAEEFDESIKYSGEGSAKNNLLAKKYMINENVTGEQKDFYVKREADFLTTAKEARLKVEELINASDVDPDFKQQQLDDAKYGYALTLINYGPSHRYFSKNNDYEVSEDFKKEHVEISYNDEEAFKNSYSYKSLVERKYQMDLSTTPGVDNLGDALLKVMPSVENDYIRQELMNQFSYMTLSPTENLDNVYNFMMENTTNEDYKKLYTEKYNRFKSLAKGAPSPTFHYENYKGGKTALADLKGKYVYIDVWATWCGPCIGEIPSLKLVEKEFHNKNIDFVSISIDTPKAYDKWKSMIAEKELGGIQLLADADWKSKFVTDYGIDGIPRFILIDPNGNIVSADAPRPSNPELTKMLKELKNM